MDTDEMLEVSELRLAILRQPKENPMDAVTQE